MNTLQFNQKQEPTAAAWHDRPTVRVKASSLVTSPISQTFLEIYPATIKVKRPFLAEPPTPPDRTDTEISLFSDKSRSRLRFLSANSNEVIKSQFCMTYGDIWPINGRELKADLNRFITSLKKAFPNLKYLWVAEIQPKRGAPHFHFFSNLDVTVVTHQILAKKWHKIAGYGQTKHLNVHSHSENFIPWKMNTGSYLCKYLDKQAQKHIPPGYQSFGRWWGNSRNLLSDPDKIPLVEFEKQFSTLVVDQFGEILLERDPLKTLIRVLGRHHEKTTKYSYIRRSNRSVMHLTGRKIYEQLIQFWTDEDQRYKRISEPSGMHLSGFNQFVRKSDRRSGGLQYCGSDLSTL